MVTDSILSVIIFKWVVINDVSAVRVLQAPGWMTSALKLPSLNSTSLSLHTRIYTSLGRDPELCASLCVSRACTHGTGESWGEESGNKSPGAKHNIDPAIHFSSILPSAWPPNTCIRSLIPASERVTGVRAGQAWCRRSWLSASSRTYSR